MQDILALLEHDMPFRTRGPFRNPLEEEQTPPVCGQIGVGHVGAGFHAKVPAIHALDVVAKSLSKSCSAVTSNGFGGRLLQLCCRHAGTRVDSAQRPRRGHVRGTFSSEHMVAICRHSLLLHAARGGLERPIERDCASASGRLRRIESARCHFHTNVPGALREKQRRCN